MIISSELQEDYRKHGIASFQFGFISEKDFQALFPFVQFVLTGAEKLYLAEVIFFIIKELLSNSSRAMAKRQYFKIHSLDISNLQDYRQGMSTMKKEILSDWEKGKELFQTSDLKGMFELERRENGLVFQIKTNTALLPQEKRRIDERYEASDKYIDIISAFRDISSSEESAGLGIVTNLIILKSIGLTKENLRISSHDGFTYSELWLPNEIYPPQITNKIKEKIINTIDMLPSLPNSISKIIVLCNSEKMDFQDLAEEIERDPAISADLLKLSNSSSFIQRNKATTVLQAVRVVGSKNILLMMYALSSAQILKDRFPRMEELWEHANRTSSYASQITREFSFFKFSEIVTIASLLHNIGNILLLAVTPLVHNVILEMTNRKNIQNTKALEEATIGISYSQLGALLAKKWNFPDELVTLIEYHQQPYVAPADYVVPAEIVYLASMLANKTENRVFYYSIDPVILRRFNLDTEALFEKYATKLETRYKMEMENSQN